MTVGTNPTDPTPRVGDPVPGEPNPQRSWIKLVISAVLVGVLLCVVYFSPLKEYLGKAEDLSQRIRSFGAFAPLMLTLIVALLVAVGFPRTVLCIMAGMALGFWSGLFWAQLGTLLGNYALFLVARVFGRDWAERMVHKRAGLLRLSQERGFTGVFMARQLPLPGVVINLLCALLPISQRDFLLGTIIGQLPQAIPCTLIGAGVLQASFKKSIGLIGLAVVLAFAAWFVVGKALRRN
jgi:uncharacterized membrane protein YdjX (TVP38/TMEM64 family)